MTGGGYSPSALPVQETGGIITRGYRGEGECVCLSICVLARWWSRVLQVPQVPHDPEQDKRFKKMYVRMNLPSINQL